MRRGSNEEGEEEEKEDADAREKKQQEAEVRGTPRARAGRDNERAAEDAGLIIPRNT